MRRPPPRSYRFRALLAAVLLAVGLSGCLQVRSLLTVFADGSGEITYTLQMRPAAFEQLKSLAQMDADNKEPFTLIDEEALRAQAKKFGPGVTFEGVKALDDADGPGYVATYRVPDVEALALPAFPRLVLPDNDADDADDEEPVTFAFEAGTPARLTIRMPEPDFDEAAADTSGAAAADTLSQEELGQIEQARMLFEGMRFTTAVRPAGALVETDATYDEAGTITLMTLDFGDMLSDPAAIQALQGSDGPQSPAEFRERMAGVPGVQMETQPTVTVVFEGE